MQLKRIRHALGLSRPGRLDGTDRQPRRKCDAPAHWFR